MKFSKIFALFFLLLVLAPGAYAQGNDAAAMDAAMKAAMPGPQHEVLKVFEGKWIQKIVTRLDPTAAPASVDGISEGRMILGGRFIQIENTGEMAGLNVSSLQIIGYDNRRQRYFTFGLDELGTYAVMAEGDYNPTTKILTMFGETEEGGVRVKFRFEFKVVDNDHYTYVVVFTLPNGTEVRPVEIDHRRVK